MRTVRRDPQRWCVALAALNAVAWLSSAAAQSSDHYVRPLSDADRAAAFPDLGDMNAHDMMGENPFNTFVLFDQLETQDAERGSQPGWNARAWAGRDLSKLWIRSEGSRVSGRTEHAELELLWGRRFARWWDWVAGARTDLRPGPAQNWAAFGVQGLAPYRFELEATAYVGDGGRSAARFETEYELLVTNRLILQPRIEMNWYSSDDPARGIGSGLAGVDAGLRLRYEIRREIAPYVGIVQERKFGATAELARNRGEETRDTRFVAGIRFWF
jgi:copper resistance protein B